MSAVRKQKKNRKNTDAGNIWGFFGTTMNVAWEIALPIFLGVLTGYFIDKNLKPHMNFTLILLFTVVATSPIIHFTSV